MLQSIGIHNYKLIDTLNISFSPHLTVITGETGAGKSILLDALRLITGDRGSPQLIKPGKQSLTVEAVFSPILPAVKDIMDRYDIEQEGEELHIFRQISDNGKNNIRVNGLPASVSILKELGDHLVDLCSQNQHQSLFSRDTHKRIVDLFGGAEIAQKKREISQLRDKYLAIKGQHEYLTSNLRSVEKEVEFIRFQLDEITQTALHPHEEEDLSVQRQKATNASLLTEAASRTLENIELADDLLRKSLTALERAAAIDPSLDANRSSLESALFMLEDMVRDLHQYSESVDFSPDFLSDIESRLDIIAALKRKYGPAFDDIFRTQGELEQRLNELTAPDYDIQSVEKQLNTHEQELLTHCKHLSELRKASGRSIEDAIRAELSDLELPHARFEVSIRNCSDDNGLSDGKNTYRLFSDGIDEVEFLFTANPGTPLGELKKIASGGELSRVMLALKNVFFRDAEKNTIIFDEVDTGISGATAVQVGKKIKQLSRDYQVICVTHLATIAANGDEHILVTKKTHRNATEIETSRLSAPQREEEIARLLGGTLSPITITHAQELLKQAQA